MTDTLFADVSYYQPPVDDSYPYEVFSFRSNDGTFQDPNFAANYHWSTSAVDSGRLAFFIVYLYLRPNWLDTVNTHRSMVSALGGPHPKMVAMLDVESGGNPPGDGSDWINRSYWNLADWLGNPERVIGYANPTDFYNMWPVRPDGLRVVAAGYGYNPDLPGKIAHQYTDGNGYGGGLPEGCPPFGNCDMNSADGLDAHQFAAACGVGSPAPEPTLTQADIDAIAEAVAGKMLTPKWFAEFMVSYIGPMGSDAKDIREQLLGGRNTGENDGYPQGGFRTLYDLVAAIAAHTGVPETTDIKAGPESV
ncbi:hypothetical protein [Nocardia arthritidis]|uniref:Uncharacterized protein n=1 Tax=Nocardia arthritidis TaxID=228602 RepID=A0A6G9YQ66_9NOCA|nr:hypothetical protein [Nocardia arthritidis]QIS15445.1 hypothetical protein F5544_38095 [Nocardia arthritidis]